MKVAVLSGGRSSEHDVSLASGAAVREGLVAGRPRGARRAPLARGTLDPRGRAARARAGRRPARRRRGVPGPARPIRRGRHGAGPARAARRALCRRGRDGLGGVDGQGALQGPDGRPRHAAGRLRGRARGRRRSALPPPAFVKPARLGSSVGIAKAWSEAELDAALAQAFEHDPVALVERFCEGLEVECSVLGHRDPVASRPGEIVLVNADWYDYEAKYERAGWSWSMPARIPDPQLERGPPAGRRGLRARRLLGHGARGLLRRGRQRARQRAEHDSRLHLHERLREAVRGAGVPYAELLDRLLGFALERHEEERRYRF